MMKDLQYTNKSRLPILDIIKGIMICCVIFTHISWESWQRQWIIFPYFVDMAVPVFLWISAYIRTKKWERTQEGYCSLYRFLLRDMLSILIPYAVMMICNIIMHILRGDASFLSGIFSFVHWLLGGESGPGSYYIAILIQMNLALPLLYILFRKTDRIWGAVICLCINIFFDGIFYYMPRLLQQDVYFYAYFYRLCFIRYIFISGLGIFFGMEAEAGIWHRKSILPLGIIGGGGDLL